MDIPDGLDLTPVWLSMKLAGVTVALLVVLGIPLAWWLARTRSPFKIPVEALTALPLVLPPTVLGFYLLVLLGSSGPAGQIWTRITGHPLAFSFTGLVIASCVYSLPFVVQPLQAAFEALDRRAVEASFTLGASRTRTFLRVVLPGIRRGLITAMVLGFAHTLGEFGVVLMVGGNIPGETQVVATAIYEYVEILDYDAAGALSAGLLGFSFLVLLLVYGANRRWHAELKL
ncbi:MAG: molybdate ABC transporter permease subunit [Chromatiaceae bacterium]|jgi:molybdate transport system permease protein|nr:molybdate ABC transporter permease subunit [Chromatiaceae bacterium]